MTGDYLSFKLSRDFVDSYRDKEVPWGFVDAAGSPVSEIIFFRTYSRKKADGSKETWVDACERVINGMYSLQKDYVKDNRLPWSDVKAQRSAEEAFDRMFNLKWTPPGRGIWMMGTELVNKHKNSAALQNCAFLSTSDIHKNDPGSAFGWLMEASMLGVGVGFDTKGSEKDIVIREPRFKQGVYVIPDSREGWVESTRLLINAYLSNGELPSFSYAEIRPAGEPIKTFGGTAAGPEPLMKLHDKLRTLFESKTGEKLDSLTIMDIANLIGVCVVSGNVRRSAELAMGSLDDEDFLTAKDYEKHPERMEWGWMSNNSVEAKVGDDLSHIEDGIALNGEPGVIWMDVTRDYGRLIDPPDYKDWRAQGYNPCAEQSLESYEMCASGETRIQTEDGLHKIKDVVGQTVRVWNGEEWAETTPFSTGVNELYRVTLSDGSYLDATPGHEWSVRKSTATKFRKVQTKDLSVGMVLPEFHLDSPDGKHNENAYTYGWVAGDGYLDGTRVMALVKEDEYPVLDILGGTVYKEQSFDNDSSVRFSRVNVSDTVPFDAAVAMRREDRLPEEVFTWDVESISDFMGGWIDTDGSLAQNPNTDHYVLYGSEGKLREAQILLRRIGVNHATLWLHSEKGTETNKGVRKQDLYRLLIPSYEADRINTRVKVATRFGDRNRVNNAHPDGNQIDSARKQKIVSIEKVSDAADTYCFNEPKRGMGVFGNVLTYQCTLVETFLNRHDDMDDFLRTLKFAFLYAKTVTLLPTHWDRTNAVMQRNRRIGVGSSGHATFVDNHGMPELREWLDNGYGVVRDWDREYSEWLGVRESIKVTTVKPSGTVSLLAGESPGVHWAPGGEYHLRGVVFQKDDPMVQLFRDAGYEIHESAYTPETSVFVQFPIRSKAKRSEKDVTIFEKANLAVNAQRYWSDNSVSVTVSFNVKDEEKFVPTVLQMHEGSLKTVSFLPQGNDTYKQQPYVSIDQSEYEEMQDNLLKVDLSPVYGNGRDAEGEKFCSTDSCEMPKG